MRIYTIENFISISTTKHNNIYDYSKVVYINTRTKVEIICCKHGSFWQTPKNHFTGQGCPTCVIRVRAFTTNKFMKLATKVHSNKYSYNLVNYINAKTKVQIVCHTHGIFFQSPNHHLSGRGCPNCNESTGERQISNYLQHRNISFKRQVRFADCKNKNPLPFDFGLYDNLQNLVGLIEFNGIQHYKPTVFQNHKLPLEEFGYIQNNDRIKKNYCTMQKIPLLIVRWDDNIQKCLKNFIIECILT